MQQELEKVMEDKYGQKRLHVERECLICKNKFWTRKKHSRSHSGLYCSLKCSHASRREQRVSVICASCGKEHYVLPRIANKQTKHGFNFCSSECKNKQHRIGGLIQPEHFGTSAARVKRKTLSPDGKCLCCKKDLKDTISALAFCSRSCQSQMAYEKYIGDWKAGIVTGNGPCGEQIHAKVRRYMLEKVGYKCERCGWAEKNNYTNKVPLSIHHKNGNPSNTVENNLEVLCPNCHSLTQTYGALNLGTGRSRRRKSYLNRNVSKNNVDTNLENSIIQT